MTAALHLPGLAAPTITAPAWGVDASSLRMSVACFRPGDVPAVRTLSMPAGGLAERYAAATRSLVDFLRRLEQQWGRPQLVLVEEPFGHGKAQVHPTSNRYLGVLLASLGLALPGVDVDLVHTQTWKVRSVGHGRASKEQVMAWAREIGYFGSLQDECDALGIAACAAQRASQSAYLEAGESRAHHRRNLEVVVLQQRAVDR